MKQPFSPPFVRRREAVSPQGDYIPVFAITGFLDAGKTTLLNSLIQSRLREGINPRCILFEEGEEDPAPYVEELKPLRLSIREVQRNPEAASKKIYQYLLEQDPEQIDEIWVEWNGMLPIRDLQTLFPAPSRQVTMTTGDFCRLQKILHVGDGEALERLLGGAGAALTDQISGCDFIVLRNARDKEFRRLRQLLRGLNPGVPVLRSDWLRDIEKALQKPRPAPNTFFLLSLVYFCVAYLLLRLVLGGTRVDGVVNVFLGILLQAVPFLLIGVLLSSAIQVFISDKLIAEKFPKHPAGGFLFALLAGFCLPVCDCTSIPVFRSIVRKGVPLSAAVTFLSAAPVINPVVMLSTWYAFGGNWQIVACRVGLGLFCAVLIGLTFSGAKFKSDVLTGGGLGALCGCGCAADTGAGKLESFMLHAQSEFFSVGKYLLLGAFVSALFQTMGAGLSRTGAGEGLLLPLLLMMAMAFLFSLCSSSDAVVARSFAAQFPMGALMGFLVFGPMMDVKNVLMLSGSFSKRFVLRLAFTMFAVCGAVVFAAFSLGLGEVLV
ncbi:permease [uncultured Oscillibacter sp.]|uniref:permease n=1 Tax=uncultured Oscillibacter sp. TaxID=876091 RepID=UPI0025EE05E4|nr:permease [uncultured Oscillibacter sp.]